MLACLLCLYATTCACFAVASMLLGAPLVALLWSPVRAVKCTAALSLLLVQHRRIALSLLPALGEPTEQLSAWVAVRSAAVHKGLAVARLAPTMLIVASVVIWDVLSLHASTAGPGAADPPSWITQVASTTGGPAHTFYAPELALAATWAVLCALCTLASYTDAHASLRWPLLHQDLFLRLRPRLLPALSGACRLCARCGLLLLLGVALAPALTLTPAVRALHAFRLARATPILLLPPSVQRSFLLVARAFWLRLLLGGAVFSVGWQAVALLIQTAYTQRRTTSLGGDGDNALRRGAPPLTQHLALLDLSLVSRFEPRRRREIFASASAFQQVVSDCVRVLDCVRARARSLDLYSKHGGAGAPPMGLSATLWQRWLHAVSLQLCCDALGSADGACWAANTLAGLLVASRSEDRLGTAQSARLVGQSLEVLTQCAAALESQAFTALLPQTRGAPRTGGQLRAATITPQQRRLSALLPGRKATHASACLAFAHARTLHALRSATHQISNAFHL